MPAVAEAAAHVVIAVRAVLLVEPGEVKHFLGLLVLAHVAVGDDAMAVGRLERRINRFHSLEGLQGFAEVADAMKVDAQMLHRLKIVGFDVDGFSIGVDRLFESFHFVERQADIKEPAAVVWIDGCGGAQLLQRLGPAALLEKLLRLFHPSLGVVPIVHDGGDLKCDPWEQQTTCLLYSSARRIGKSMEG